VELQNVQAKSRQLLTKARNSDNTAQFIPESYAVQNILFLYIYMRIYQSKPTKSLQYFLVSKTSHRDPEYGLRKSLCFKRLHTRTPVMLQHYEAALLRLESALWRASPFIILNIHMAFKEETRADLLSKFQKMLLAMTKMTL